MNNHQSDSLAKWLSVLWMLGPITLAIIAIICQVAAMLGWPPVNS